MITFPSREFAFSHPYLVAIGIPALFGIATSIGIYEFGAEIGLNPEAMTIPALIFGVYGGIYSFSKIIEDPAYN